jgi:uncharacterized membrane protein
MTRDTRRRSSSEQLAFALGVFGLGLGLSVLGARVLGPRASGPRRGRLRSDRDRQIHVDQAITINRPIDEVYRSWRDVENFPRFMRHLTSVAKLDARRSRWRAAAPAGTTVEWVAEIVEDRAPERIAWRSIEGSQVETSGLVAFHPAPGARGTEVRVKLSYTPPAGALGRGVAWIFGDNPEWLVTEDLRRFKQFMETGEIPISEGPGLWRPAQPPRRPEELRTVVGVRA